MRYEPELAAALQAAESAGRAVLEQYERFEVIPDAPATISTDADRQAQEIILTALHAAFPADAFCAEETTPTLATLGDAARTGQRIWIIDPIDGTRGFARKNGEFSVMVALVEGGRTAVGVVLEPAHGRLTYAVQGGGCWCRDGGEARPCRVSTIDQLAQMTLVQSRPRDRSKPTRPVRALAPATVLETYSAGIKLALVARGEADVYVNTYEAFRDWDVAAGHILVEEAGGKVSGLRGETLEYGKPGAWQRSGLLATNGHLHDATLEGLKAVL
jgi:3'(2'), 5'-bisphosphate nucleotidase